MPKRWEIQEHSNLDKRFVIDGPLPLIIDNDDVPSDVVAMLAERVAVTLNAHYKAPLGRRCENDDCEDPQVWPAAFAYCPTCGERLGEPLLITL